MSRALSDDLRVRLVSAVDAGMSRRAAAERFGVAISTAVKWVQQWRREGHVRAKAKGGDTRSHRLEAYGEEIIALIEETPHITLAEIAAHLDETHGVKAAQSSIWRLLDRRGWTYKKNRPRR